MAPACSARNRGLRLRNFTHVPRPNESLIHLNGTYRVKQAQLFETGDEVAFLGQDKSPFMDVLLTQINARSKEWRQSEPSPSYDGYQIDLELAVIMTALRSLMHCQMAPKASERSPGSSEDDHDHWHGCRFLLLYLIATPFVCLGLFLLL